MDTLQIFVAVAAAVILFLFGIEHFSREVQAVSGARFRAFLGRATGSRFAGFGLGAAVTAVIQSSTATSVIAVGLVNAGALSFRHSLGVLFGANVGTTVTAQLVAFKLTSFAPALILIGFAAGYMPFRWRILGRSIFYFGIVFFSLDLVSAAVAPLRADPEVIELLGRVRGPIAGVLVGALFTAIVQSSSVTTGIVIILLDQGVVEFDGALPLILGANVGTTVTALLAASALDTSARRTAVSHALYNVGGVLVVLPLLGLFEALLAGLDQPPAATLATAHLAFNLATATLFLALLSPFARLVERLVPDDAAEESLPPPPALDDDTDAALRDARAWLAKVAAALPRHYIAAVLALETRDSKIESRAGRIGAIVRYALTEGRDLVSRVSRRSLTEAQSREVLGLVITLDHIRQLSDSVDDVMAIGDNLGRRGVRLSMDALLDVQAVYPRAAKQLQKLERAFAAPADAVAAIRAADAELAGALGEAYLRYIKLAMEEREGAELADFLSIHQRMRSKILAFADHLADPAGAAGAAGARSTA